MLFSEPAPAPKEEGPAGGQTCPEDISRNKEEAEEDDQEEGDGQRTGELVKGILKPAAMKSLDSRYLRWASRART